MLMTIISPINSMWKTRKNEKYLTIKNDKKVNESVIYTPNDINLSVYDFVLELYYLLFMISYKDDVVCTIFRIEAHIENIQLY